MRRSFLRRAFPFWQPWATTTTTTSTQRSLSSGNVGGDSLRDRVREKLFKIEKEKGSPPQGEVPEDLTGIPAQGAADDVFSKIPDVGPSFEQPEVGGPKGPEPTRFGDWERKGRVSDF